MEAWAFGLKSTVVVQREAAVAVADGANHEDLLKLARLRNAVHDDIHGPYSVFIRSSIALEASNA